ncbi:hypothetical protein H4S01_006973 [Coemansia sp. RSA 2610]|nr:hypothetical protein H4S01_006973 [Coemansia sp. RSA 2610]
MGEAQQGDSPGNGNHSSDSSQRRGRRRSESASSGASSDNGAAAAASAMWHDDLSNLLTPQTVVEQAQVRRRKRNREAARRSRQRQKERERGLVERQEQLTLRLKSLEQELTEWRMINSAAGDSSRRLIEPDDVSNSEDGALANNINRVYSLTMDTLHIISQLQLQLDEITAELNLMIGRN